MSLDPCNCRTCTNKIRRKPHLRWRGIARSRGMTTNEARKLSSILRRFGLTIQCNDQCRFRFLAFRGPYSGFRQGEKAPCVIDGLWLTVEGTR